VNFGPEAAVELSSFLAIEIEVERTAVSEDLTYPHLGSTRDVSDRRRPSKDAMETTTVVVVPPRIDLGLGLGQRQKPVLVQTLDPELPIERLDERVLRGLSQDD
jgi:hypothetical protein